MNTAYKKIPQDLFSKLDEKVFKFFPNAYKKSCQNIRTILSVVYYRPFYGTRRKTPFGTLDSHECIFSLSELSKITGLGIQAVREALAKLKTMGILLGSRLLKKNRVAYAFFNPCYKTAEAKQHTLESLESAIPSFQDCDFQKQHTSNKNNTQEITTDKAFKPAQENSNTPETIFIDTDEKPPEKQSKNPFLRSDKDQFKSKKRGLFSSSLLREKDFKKAAKDLLQPSRKELAKHNQKGGGDWYWPSEVDIETAWELCKAEGVSEIAAKALKRKKRFVQGTPRKLKDYDQDPSYLLDAVLHEMRVRGEIK